MDTEEKGGMSWERLDEIRAMANDMKPKTREIIVELLDEVERLKEILRELFGV